MEVTAEDLANEEWGPVKTKKGKGAKGKSTENEESRQGTLHIAEVTSSAPHFYDTGSPAPTTPIDGVADNDENAAEESGPKILSKKEKEKLKKEREKVTIFSSKRILFLSRC